MRQELRHEPPADLPDETELPVIDAAESRWDPVLRVLYLRELAEQHRRPENRPD